MSPSVSVKDVAIQAGVAVGTVSNVLNHPEKVSPGTRARVLTTIEDLGFVRNDVARQLRAGNSRTIGLIVLDVGNPFFSALARSAQDAASKQGQAILLGDSGQDVSRESDYIDLFQEQQVQGLLISPVGDMTYRLKQLHERGIPTVLVDRHSDDERCSSVSVDNEAGGYLAAKHLLDGGRRQLAFVGGPLAIRQVSDRLRGALRAVSEVSGAVIEALDSRGQSVMAGRRAGDQLMVRPRGKRPDGVFCANDLLALGVMQALTVTHSLRIPEDVALIGYDDIDFASSAVVPLSSVRQPTEALGTTAVDILMSLINGDTANTRVVVFAPELVPRRSTEEFI